MCGAAGYIDRGQVAGGPSGHLAGGRPWPGPASSVMASPDLVGCINITNISHLFVYKHISPLDPTILLLVTY